MKTVKKILVLCFCFCAIQSTTFGNELTDKALDQMNQNSIENQMTQKFSDRQWEEDQARLKEKIRQNNEKTKQQKERMASDFAKAKESFASGTLSPEQNQAMPSNQEKFLESFNHDKIDTNSNNFKNDLYDFKNTTSDNEITERKQQHGTIKNKPEKETGYYNPAIPQEIKDSQVTQKKGSEWTDKSYTKLLLIIILLFIIMTILFFNGKRKRQ